MQAKVRRRPSVRKVSLMAELTRRHLYLASPLGFDAAGRHYYAEQVLPAVVAAGFAVADPWDAAHLVDLPIDAATEGASATNRLIGQRNADLIDGCDGVLAFLDGVDVDSGTASEIGFACARGLPIVGVRTDMRSAGDNPAARVNLQVEYFIQRTGGRIVDDLASGLAAIAGLLPAAA
jgi:nucleoside 2-deoxyribosyltransferase